MTFNTNLSKRLGRKLERAITFTAYEKDIFLNNWIKKKILRISTETNVGFSVNEYEMFLVLAFCKNC